MIYLLNIYYLVLDYINPLFLFFYLFDKMLIIHVDHEYIIIIIVVIMFEDGD